MNSVESLKIYITYKTFKIFIPVYVWILSRIPIITFYNKELAVRPLSQIGVVVPKLAFDDWTKCEPRSYDTVAVEPVTFRLPVKTHRRFSDEQISESSQDRQ